MTLTSGTKRRQRKSKARPRTRQNLQKPNGVIGPRVAKVGGSRFAIVCIDPAKHRSEWMIADYFGKILIPAETLSHEAAFFKLAVAKIRKAIEEHDIQDLIVVVERGGGVTGTLPLRCLPADWEKRRALDATADGVVHSICGSQAIPM